MGFSTSWSSRRSTSSRSSVAGRVLLLGEFEPDQPVAGHRWAAWLQGDPVAVLVPGPQPVQVAVLRSGELLLFAWGGGLAAMVASACQRVSTASYSCQAEVARGLGERFSELRFETALVGRGVLGQRRTDPGPDRCTTTALTVAIARVLRACRTRRRFGCGVAPGRLMVGRGRSPRLYEFRRFAPIWRSGRSHCLCGSRGA